jgi:hypothetical protein
MAKNEMMQVYSYGTLYLVNFLGIYFANLWFPAQVVLGTVTISLLWALILSAGTTALLGTLAMPFFQVWEQKRQKELSPLEWMVGYLVVNCVSIWLITRKSELFGMGVSSWIVVIALGIVLNILQAIAMTKLQKNAGA